MWQGSFHEPENLYRQVQSSACEENHQKRVSVVSIVRNHHHHPLHFTITESTFYIFDPKLLKNGISRYRDHGQRPNYRALRAHDQTQGQARQC